MQDWALALGKCPFLLIQLYFDLFLLVYICSCTDVLGFCLLKEKNIITILKCIARACVLMKCDNKFIVST